MPSWWRLSLAVAAPLGRRGCCWRRWRQSPTRTASYAGLSTEQPCAAAGVTDRTYRQARHVLLASGELVLTSGPGGRGNTNIWNVPDPRRLAGAAPARVARRAPPPLGSGPLVNTDQDRTVSGENCPVGTGVLDVNGGQDRTLFELPRPETPAETPAQTRAETPAPHTRAGREPQNPRTGKTPTAPLQGEPTWLDPGREDLSATTGDTAGGLEVHLAAEQLVVELGCLLVLHDLVIRSCG